MNEIVIFDIEASCDDRTINPHYNMETIEIGAVKLSRGIQVDEFETFICPEYVYELTPYCTELIGITFADLEGAPKFTSAILDFHNFIKGSKIYSCGDFDRKFLVREIEEKGYSYEHKLARNAIDTSHINLKKYYNKITGNKMRGMIGMANELGVQLIGEHHRALSDANNLASIYLRLEEIREDKLRAQLPKLAMIKILVNLNNEHPQYESKLYSDNLYQTHDKLTGVSKEYTFVEFLDYWGPVIITDFEVRGLRYITLQQLKVLKRYTNLR